MTKRIYIDAGHGGTDCGAINGTRKEADDVLKMALKVADCLKVQNCEVKLSRSTNISRTIKQRYNEANNWNADYFLSIHRNSGKNTATGNEIWVYSKADQNTVTKAQNILNAVCKADGLKNRGVKKGAVSYSDYGVNKYTKMPASLLELGFISNLSDNKALDNKFNAIALVIAKALLKAVNVDWKNSTTSDTKSYLARVTAKSLDIRKGAGTNYPIVGEITDKGTYTIVDTVDGWGKLKSGAGYISLKYTEKVK